MRIRRVVGVVLALAMGWGVAARAQNISQASSGYAQYLAGFEKQTTVKVLPNGLTLIVCERPEAPVFSFYTLVDAGSADDPQGASGLAHMFEHIAFKGTDRDRHNELSGGEGRAGQGGDGLRGVRRGVSASGWARTRQSWRR